jgi:hypothetical protein
MANDWISLDTSNATHQHITMHSTQALCQLQRRPRLPSTHSHNLRQSGGLVAVNRFSPSMKIVCDSDPSHGINNASHASLLLQATPIKAATIA